MDYLKLLLSHWNITISDEQLFQFDKFYELLIYWNERMNLTAITDKDEVIVKHFFDSLALINYCDLDNKTLIDVGTGGGFPGIPLKILVPSCKITLLDSLQKRVGFLNEVINELNLKDISAIHYRAEDAGHNKKYREKYDFATSRAVANLSTLSEYCLPFVKVNGSFVSYKGGNVSEEVDNAKKAINIVGGSIDNIFEYNLPETDFSRTIVSIKKVKATSGKYPRKAGTPSKEPIS